MASPRSHTVDPDNSGVYHCTSRCVRRAFLCGRDSHSGQNFEHRRDWIRDRLRELSGLYSMQIISYCVMSNHLHVVVRTLPEQVPLWGDEEVAYRWLRLFPGTRSKPAEEPPDEAEIKSFCKDRDRLADARARLGNLSWFMRSLNEPIARRANHEDGCTGHFWEGRFKSQKLADDGAALACMVYVDLNPVRAGIADTLEGSDFTSAQDRIAANLARRQLAQTPPNPTPPQFEFIERARSASCRDHWLAPIGPHPEETSPSASDSSSQVSPSSQGPPASQPPRIDPPPLLAHLSEELYLELLDWTGRQIRSGKRGHLSPTLRPLLERLDLDVEAWVDNVERYGGLFHRFACKLSRLKELAATTGCAWLRGHRGARRLYAQTA